MNPVVLILLLLLTAASVATPALAGENRFYIGTNISRASMDGNVSLPVGEIQGNLNIPFAAGLSADYEFDDDSVGWSAFGGYRVTEYLSLETGYTDFGDFGWVNQFAGITSWQEFTLGLNNAELSVEEIYVATRLNARLNNWLSADWLLGITRVDFGITGPPSQITLFFPFNPNPPFPVDPDPPPSTQPQSSTIIYKEPNDETGLVWGFGFTWHVSESIGIGAFFRQHDVQVQKIDRVGVSIEFGF